MDVLAHSLWTNVMYKVIKPTRSDKKITSWGVFFGVFPDIVAFTPIWLYILYGFIFRRSTFIFAKPEDENLIPLSNLTHTLYSFSHSLVIWAVIFAIVWLVIQKMPWVLLGWALHILIDIFSHSNQFYPTPFLFPISKFHINGYAWSEPIFMVVNYGALVLLYSFFIPRIKRQR
ncbi:MAG: metal-dependent hydrolase [Candidatus Doudnabacteria bacterium]|nr:metal-dependent hydrolase [Candidatus Doudnabacteria bacterium]